MNVPIHTYNPDSLKQPYRGQVREDGMVFCGYQKCRKGKTYELWRSPDSLARTKAYNAEYQRRFKQRKKQREYARNYYRRKKAERSAVTPKTLNLSFWDRVNIAFRSAVLAFRLP